jgi:hypothetical protein
MHPAPPILPFKPPPHPPRTPSSSSPAPRAWCTQKTPPPASASWWAAPKVRRAAPPRARRRGSVFCPRPARLSCASFACSPPGGADFAGRGADPCLPRPRCLGPAVWNWVVSTITLMALGSSAPEILLSSEPGARGRRGAIDMQTKPAGAWPVASSALQSARPSPRPPPPARLQPPPPPRRPPPVIETLTSLGEPAGKLGPAVVVGAAAFNIFNITLACTIAMPTGVTKRISQYPVFLVTGGGARMGWLRGCVA